MANNDAPLTDEYDENHPLLVAIRRGWYDNTTLQEEFEHQYPNGTWVAKDLDNPNAIMHFAVGSGTGTGKLVFQPVWVTACGKPYQGSEVQDIFGIWCRSCKKTSDARTKKA